MTGKPIIFVCGNRNEPKRIPTKEEEEYFRKIELAFLNNELPLNLWSSRSFENLYLISKDGKKQLKPTVSEVRKN